MFKRNYFVHFEIWRNGGEVSRHFRIFYVKSWFPEKPDKIINFKEKQWSENLGCDPEQIHITAFNRI